jgi:hypothetical protein
LSKDAAFDPKLKRVIELQARYDESGKPLEEVSRRFEEWLLKDGDQDADQRRETWLHAIVITDLLAITCQWKDEEFRELFNPADRQACKDFAKRLIEQDMDPSPFLRDPESATAAIDEVRSRLYQKLEAKIGKEDVPPEFFNQSTCDFMIDASLGRNLKALAYRLATPETQKFADAAYVMRARGNLHEFGYR